MAPIWQGGTHDEPALLERAYDSCFRLAAERVNIRTIAFPSISTGIYGYPKRDAPPSP